MSDPDELITAILAFRSAATTVAAHEAQKRRAELQEARSTIERARNWVKESGAGVSACRLYEAAKPWSAWAKRDDWAKWNSLSVTDVEGEGSVVDKSHVAFTRRERRWKITHVHSRSFAPDDNCSRGTLTINVDGSDVLELMVCKSYEEYSSWQPAEVNALTVGSWVAELVEMDVVLEQAQKRSWAEMEAKRLQEQAAKIKL